jgi:spore germination cell wall hydrolase CwlJ-like protein
MPVTEQEIDTLARNLWGEGRGTGKAGMSHIANVIINRANTPCWWGHDIITVCLAPHQFSCRNPGDPNLPKLLAVTAADPQFKIALDLAALACAGNLPDATNGADSYYALSMTELPAWAKMATRTFSDGFHAFYKTR